MMRCLLFAVAAAASTIKPEQASKLRSLGYRASEIAAIRPTVASVVARRGLPRPRAGMPSSWVDESYDPYEEPEPSPLENVARFLRGVATVLERIARTGGIPLGVVLAVSQANGVTIQLPNFLAPRGDEHYAGEGFLFDGPCDPAMR